MRDPLGHPEPALLQLLLGGFEHEHQRPFRGPLVVAMNPDPWSERVVEPELVAVRRVEPAAERQAERTRAGAGPLGATVEAQRVGARFGRVSHP